MALVTTNPGPGRVVFFKPTPEQHAAALRKADRYSFQVEAASAPGQLAKRLGAPREGVLVLCSFSAQARVAAKSVRAKKGWERLSVFAIVPDDQINPRMLKEANALQIELMPTSMPEGRRWQLLRAAHDTTRAGRQKHVCNLRASFRLPLKAKAKLIFDAETIDISLGGLAFMTNQVYHLGDWGSVDIRSLLGDMEEEERGFRFEVVSVKPARHESYRYLIGAKFSQLSKNALKRLGNALEVIEPTTDD